MRSKEAGKSRFRQGEVDSKMLAGKPHKKKKTFSLFLSFLVGLTSLKRRSAQYHVMMVRGYGQLR